MPPRASLLLWFYCFLFQVIWSKLPPFEEILSVTFGCRRKKSFSTEFTLYDIFMSCVICIFPPYFKPRNFIQNHLMAYWLTPADIVSYLNVFKPSLTNYPYSKIFSLQLLLEEYLERNRVVGETYLQSD